MSNKTTNVLLSAMAMFSTSYCLFNVFPYIGFMVVHFTGESKEEAGYKAGLLASAFMLARIPTSFIWGFVADRVGRKPVLILGCGTMFLFQVMLGFAPTFEIAVLSRLLTGLFSGVVGTSKTIASELVSHSPEDQAFAMNTLTIGTNLG
mmetsp:Transcript_29218/g.46968  ORF Transcript_29218/g.46968 Transcript_29218/m.46968 type:complete len:149 (-) Transcript_29218:1144-1590(-)